MKQGYLQELFSKAIEYMPRQTNQPPPNKEALLLYREVVKISKQFNWKDPTTGELYGQMIQRSARKEFEIARYERDPLIVMKMICTTRESVNNIKQKMAGELHRYSQQMHAERMDSLYNHLPKYEQLYKQDNAQEAIRRYIQKNSN